jgi:membrane-bound metal-dependent hydrolase YbcI (DUF457 family)
MKKEAMSKPYIHALSSVKRFGGKIEDYLPIHELLDSSKAITADNRHRIFTHNSWFVAIIIPKIFGETFTNSDGMVLSSREIAEQHILEDYGNRFIPTAQDFLDEVKIQSWMLNGIALPNSAQKMRAFDTKPQHLIQD